TIGELDAGHDWQSSVSLPFPRIKVVEHYWWTGRPHSTLFPQLVDILKNVWRVKRAVVDATGVGAGVASFLSSVLGKSVVSPFIFTQASKSKIGFDLLAAINSGRVKMYAPYGSNEFREFHYQAEKAKSSYKPNQTMNFYVDPAVGHDDFLMSLALLVAAADYTPRSARGYLREGQMV
ncbi:MAG: hypothetical protein JSV02_02660, partial [Dehalococcoidia bacterium]